MTIKLPFYRYYAEKTRTGSMIRFWRKREHCDSSSAELIFSRRFKFLPSFSIYQTEQGDNEDRSEWRLSAEWAWFRLNAKLWRSDKAPDYRTERDGKLIPCKSYEGSAPGYGFYVLDSDVTLKWGHRNKTIRIPIVSMLFQQRELLALDGSGKVIAVDPGWRDQAKEQDYAALKEANSESYPYRYVRKNGEIQNVTAKVRIERMIWRRKWTPIKVRVDYLEIWFDSGVGEGVDSWKGGTIGCSFKMQKRETAQMALRRMEKTEKFDR